MSGFEHIRYGLKSKIYMLLLFNPHSLKKLNETIYGDPNHKGRIWQHLKELESAGYIISYKKGSPKPWDGFFPDGKLPGKYDPREIFYRANLTPLLQYWKAVLRKRKAFLMKKYRRVAMEQNPHEKRMGDRNTIANSISDRLNENFLEPDDLDKLGSYFFNNVEQNPKKSPSLFFKDEIFFIFRDNFNRYLSRFADDPCVKWDAMEILTNLFSLIFERIYLLELINALEDAIISGKIPEHLKSEATLKVMVYKLRLNVSEADKELGIIAEKMKHEEFVKFINTIKILREDILSTSEIAETIVAGRSYDSYGLF